ncbi:helix-turn-helix domain-containing protein [Niallia sp. 01092]|uniref:helix-turn-helix domain-containing protein n=1 Tax=unclassified Niallia TaxID=2837522 RepID=UPI003FCF7159
MSFMETLVLHCMQIINGERTIYSILHMLNGKKSSQTIQDIHLFQLTALFQTFPSLTRADFEKVITKLEENGWIHKVSDQHYVVKKEKYNKIKDLLQKCPIPRLKGWRYYQLTTVFWERLSLFVQVTSHLAVSKVRYLPVQRDRFVQDWLKETIYSVKIPRNELSKQLYKEIIECLEKIEGDPRYLIVRLTGVDYVGLTSQQAAEQLQMDHDYYHVCFLSILHYMIERIIENEQRFPLLKKMINTNSHFLSLTKSTATTYEYLQLGYSVEEICRIRQLKQSTIEDHIVEMVLNIPSFLINEFVAEDKIKQIENCAKQTSSKSLKQLKERLANVSYFEIRVVLARLGDKW